MQILSSLIPGVRDVRAPLAAGYMWLVFGWLVVFPKVDAASGNAVGEAAMELGQTVSRAGLLVAVSVAAYLIGSVSTQVYVGLGRAWQAWGYFGPRLHGERVGAMRGFELLASQALTTITEHCGDAPEEDRRAEFDILNALLEEREHELVAFSEAELRLPATILVGDKPELFAEVDRLRAEGEFRVAVALPLLALGLLVIIATPWWIAGVAICLAAPELFRQGVQLDASSRSLIANARQMGKIASPSAERFRTWVEEELPAELERRRQERTREARRETRSTQRAATTITGDLRNRQI